jgi:hypothetical protein
MKKSGLADSPFFTTAQEVDAVAHPSSATTKKIKAKNRLEPVCKIRKKKNGSDSDHGREISCSFFIACGNATKLLETTNEPLDNVSFAIERFFKGTSATLITSASNRTANMFLMKIRAKSLAGVAFVCHQSLGAQSQLT